MIAFHSDHGLLDGAAIADLAEMADSDVISTSYPGRMRLNVLRATFVASTRRSD
jgi:hypothetical protein